MSPEIPKINVSPTDQNENSQKMGQKSSYVNLSNSHDLNKYVCEMMASVSSRTMDLMIMEMRKLDRSYQRNF